MFKEEAILEAKEMDPDFLEEVYNRETRQMNYVCPACGNGSGDSGTGLSKNKEGYYHCFRCGEHMDVFELAKKANGFSDFPEAALWVFDYYGIEDYEEEDEKWKKMKKKVHLSKFTPVWDLEKYYANYIKQTQENPDYSYLLNRGISVKTQIKYGIGYDDNFVHPRILWKNDGSALKHIPTKRCIIPTSEGSAVARDIRSEHEMPQYQKNYRYMKIGPVHFFNFDSLRGNTDYTFIVEGEIDALSLIECGYSCVALGSAENVDKFVDALVENQIYIKTFFVIGDADSAGQEMSKKLVSKLKKELLCNKAYSVELPRGVICKDVNAFLCKNKKGMISWLNQVLLDACLYKEVSISSETWSKLCQTASSLKKTISDYLGELIEEQWKSIEKDL